MQRSVTREACRVRGTSLWFLDGGKSKEAPRKHLWTPGSSEVVHRPRSRGESGLTCKLHAVRSIVVWCLEKHTFSFSCVSEDISQMCVPVVYMNM